MSLKLTAIAAQGTTKKIASVSKDSKAVKLDSGEIVTVNALTEAIKGKLVNVIDDDSFELAEGVSMFKRRDGNYGFTNKGNSTSNYEF